MMTKYQANTNGNEKMDTVYTVPEVAKQLKLSRSNLYKLVKTEQIPHIKIGKNSRIRHSDLMKWLEDQTQR